MFILPLLIFLSVTLALAGLYLWLAPKPAHKRLRALEQPEAQSAHWRVHLVRLATPLARLSTPQGHWADSPLRLKFLQAGIRHADARFLYFGLKSALPLLLAGLAYVALRAGGLDGLTLLLYLCLAALLGAGLPNLLLHLATRQRQRVIFEAFPDATDLMLVCMEAGLGLDAALSKVAEEIRLSCGALADELHLTLLELRAGASRDQALRHLSLRTGVPEIATFALMLRQADRFGTSIGESLRVYSQELRRRRMVRAEEIAAKVPTQMLLPLVLCIFPAIILVVIGPAVIQIVRTLMPMLGGQG